MVSLDDARDGPLVTHCRGDSVLAAVKIHRISVAGTILCGLIAVSGVSSADPVTRASVEGSLGGYEQGVDVATVRSWGSEGASILIAISRDPSLLFAVRARALHALRAFAGDVRVRDHLRATAADPTQSLFLVRASLDALTEGFDDVAEVSRYLSDARVDVRDGAAWSLAASTNPAARAALRDRLRVESDPGVRATITDALARPTSAPAAPVVTPPAAARASVVPTSATRAVRRRVSRSR